MRTLDILNLEGKIKNVKDYMQSLNKPFIIDVSDDLSFFDLENYHPVEYNHQNEIRQYLTEISQIDDTYDTLKICKKICIEDEDWGEWRNEELNGKYYYRFVLKSEYVELVYNFLNNYLDSYQELLEEYRREEAKEQAEKEERKKQFELKKTYKNIPPSGGEMGTDGYFEADIRHVETGEVIRVVAKNIFDFGYVSFVKDKDIDETNLTQDLTQNEKGALRWVYEFARLNTCIRM